MNTLATSKINDFLKMSFKKQKKRYKTDEVYLYFNIVDENTLVYLVVDDKEPVQLESILDVFNEFDKIQIEVFKATFHFDINVEMDNMVKGIAKVNHINNNNVRLCLFEKNSYINVSVFCDDREIKSSLLKNELELIE